MNTNMRSSSALAQTGWNFSAASSSPLTLPATDKPRRPYFLTPSTSCSTARSGYCSATVANATNRSGCAAQILASPSFWIAMILAAVSRSALYQNGLILSASTSMPCWSITWTRSCSGDKCSSDGFGFTPISAIASGITQWQCTSTVFTRRPFTTVSRRRACAGCCARAPLAPMRLQPTNASSPIAPAPPRISLRLIMFSSLPAFCFFERCASYTDCKPESHLLCAGTLSRAMHLREPQRGQQERGSGIGPRIDAGELLDAVEPEINRVGMKVEALRGPLHIEIAVGESCDRARELACRLVIRAKMTHPFGDQPERRGLGAA